MSRLFSSRKAFEFNFGWMFAIIVGAVVIFLAVYSVAKIIDSQNQIRNTVLAKEIGTLFNPLETSMENEKISVIRLNQDTRIFNDCSVQGNFGVQLLSTSEKSGIGAEWGKPGQSVSFYNKYVFSSSTVEGRELLVFSKPFNFPFPVANLIYLIPVSQKYCFVNPPTAMQDDLESLAPQNINVTSDTKDCPKRSTKVCFSTGTCDINVDIISKTIRKDRQTLYYSGLSTNGQEDDSLLYGAVFSDPGIYECQLKRLMKRASELSLIYVAKSNYLSPKGCNSNLEPELTLFANATRGMNKSSDISMLGTYADNIRRTHDLLSCPLF